MWRHTHRRLSAHKRGQAQASATTSLPLQDRRPSNPSTTFHRQPVSRPPYRYPLASPALLLLYAASHLQAASPDDARAPRRQDSTRQTTDRQRRGAPAACPTTARNCNACTLDLSADCCCLARRVLVALATATLSRCGANSDLHKK
ncbi:hypothetical protein SVAN01_09238 [Stagonosporopsis vannaccii]|nr:hypothetical protein SVAN01_09238 [Stagonosporopsis vannaccii]